MFAFEIMASCTEESFASVIYIETIYLVFISFYICFPLVRTCQRAIEHDTFYLPEHRVYLPREQELMLSPVQFQGARLVQIVLPKALVSEVLEQLHIQ